MARYKTERGYTLVPSTERAYIKRQIKKLGVEIQLKRKQAGYTQESLAEALNVSTVGVRHIERGVRAPSLQMLLRIIRKLNIDIILKSK